MRSLLEAVVEARLYELAMCLDCRGGFVPVLDTRLSWKSPK